MGEAAPEDCSDEFLLIGYDLVSQGTETSTVIGKKIYVVGGSNGGDNLAFNVKIFDKLKGKWMIPTVLGAKPVPSEGHSAILMNDTRILILKRDCLPDDCTWFLEVDTPFVKEQKELLGTEVVAWSKGVIGDGSVPIVISGPSGVGKGTLISRLMKEFPSTFGFSVSHTTRAPREKEIDGVHYHFAKRRLMEREITEGKFLESALVHGNLYGTSIEAVEAVTDDGKRCILDIDVQGARSVRASCLEAIFIFISPPSLEVLEKRLRARGTETEEQVQRRLKNARTELDQGKSPGLFDHILVNNDLELCCSNLKKTLTLDEGTHASYRALMRNIKGLCSVSKRDKKILIQCSSSELGATNPSLLELDTSSLKGGAPCQTRGLNVRVVDHL